MMIAQRFRTAGWLAGVASAGIGLYLISLQVAAERGRLERVERQIAATRGEVRMLQTEFGARASMRQLDRWNGEVLALSTPRAVQFLRGQVQLASFNPATLDPNYQVPKVITAAAKVEPPKAPVAPVTAAVRYATYTKPTEVPTPAKVAAGGAAQQPLLRRAALTSAPAKPLVEQAVGAKPMRAEAAKPKTAAAKPTKVTGPAAKPVKVAAVKPVKPAKASKPAKPSTSAVERAERKR